MMEETICLQCGDRGYTNAFVYCVKCLDFAVHRYCLDVIPKKTDEFVRWVCDDCAAKLKKRQYLVHKCDHSPSDTAFSSKELTNTEGLTRNGTKENDSVVVKTEINEPVCKDGPEQSRGKNDEQNSSSQLLKEERTNTNSQKKTIKKKKKKKKQKTRKLTVIECSQASFEQTHEQRLKVDPTLGTKSATDSILPSKVEENKVSGQPFDSDNGPGSLVHPLVSAGVPERSLKKLKTVEIKGLDLGNLSAVEERKVEVGLECVENGEQEDTERRTSSTSLRSNVCRDYPQDLDVGVAVAVAAAAPVSTPIWSGCFSILNKKYDNLDEVVAHPSSKACAKVYDTASQFEPMLQFEMLPKSEIWPKSFQKSEPSENIALYFFPSKISEQDFDVLVEKMIKEELGLKAVVQNAELLIFNSTELPLSYWRFQGKYYIWGVFRAKQQPPSQTRSVAKKISSSLAGGSPPSCSSRA